MGKLSATKVKALRAAGRYADGSGLILNVTPKGSKSWILRIQHNGKRHDYGLGSCLNVSLADAREEALRIRKMVRDGKDPRAERRKENVRSKTFREAAIEYHATHQESWKNGKHRAQWLSTLQSYAFPRLGDLALNAIDGPVILDTLDGIWLAKPETARRVRQRIGSVLDYAYSRGWRDTEAPMRSVSKGLPRQPTKRGHFAAMPYSDVPDFIRELGDRESYGRLALEALILTAVRSGEIRGAIWSEVNFDAALWTIPAERMKAGEEHIVPLSSSALQVFERAKELRIAGTEFVFPGTKLGKPLSDMTLLKILRDLSLPYTVHGFRSSFRDWAAERSALPGEVAEAALAHRISDKIVAHYLRTDFLDQRRHMMAAWGSWCTGEVANGAQRRSK
ncbi:integrase [Parasphingopyxis lamellibrachiae]|uniref:Integrase n=1 Tax=Parasphingopyxis lamellibrachiae TaxID=680125 RepID=A0A3D9FIM9_9SPHN|nr:site-specific integrase [Parasphingopyxis lamellibrachiae]RED17498.1 integrase [Parasphingopyxis lamellibrachiae]